MVKLAGLLGMHRREFLLEEVCFGLALCASFARVNIECVFGEPLMLTTRGRGSELVGMVGYGPATEKFRNETRTALSEYLKRDEKSH
jgi:hypothetical protein